MHVTHGNDAWTEKTLRQKSNGFLVPYVSRPLWGLHPFPSVLSPFLVFPKTLLGSVVLLTVNKLRFLLPLLPSWSESWVSSFFSLSSSSAFFLIDPQCDIGFICYTERFDNSVPYSTLTMISTKKHLQPCNSIWVLVTISPMLGRLNYFTIRMLQIILLDLLHPFCPYHPPLSNHKLVLCTYGCISDFCHCLFIFLFHIWVKFYGISPSLSHLTSPNTL